MTLLLKEYTEQLLTEKKGGSAEPDQKVTDAIVDQLSEYYRFSFSFKDVKGKTNQCTLMVEGHWVTIESKVSGMFALRILNDRITIIPNKKKDSAVVYENGEEVGTIYNINETILKPVKLKV